MTHIRKGTNQQHKHKEKRILFYWLYHLSDKGTFHFRIIDLLHTVSSNHDLNML